MKQTVWIWVHISHEFTNHSITQNNNNNKGFCIFYGMYCRYHHHPPIGIIGIHYSIFHETCTRLVLTLSGIHDNDVIMSAAASQITGVSIVCSSVGSGATQIKHQSSASLAFVWGIHQWPVNSPHKGPVTQKMFPFDNVIILVWCTACYCKTKHWISFHNRNHISHPHGRAMMCILWCILQ